MIEHHLQKYILHRLVLQPEARFAELKPHDMDSNAFTYHLQQLIKQRYVVKNEDGTYGLTAQGKAAGVNISLPAKAVLEQAHAILLLAVRDTDGAWLLRRRLAHPTYGQIGFVHGEPVATEAASDTARAILERRTGLTADFAAVGAGYVRIFAGEALESFTAFTLLATEIEHQEPKARDDTGENLWLTEPDFTAPDMLPSMPELVQHLSGDVRQPFFADLTYRL